MGNVFTATPPPKKGALHDGHRVLNPEPQNPNTKPNEGKQEPPHSVRPQGFGLRVSRSDVAVAAYGLGWMGLGPGVEGEFVFTMALYGEHSL